MVFYTIMVIIGNILRSQNPEWIILSLQCFLPLSQSQLLYIQAAYLHTPLLKLCRTRQSLTFTLFCWHNSILQFCSGCQLRLSYSCGTLWTYFHISVPTLLHSILGCQHQAFVIGNRHRALLSLL